MAGFDYFGTQHQPELPAVPDSTPETALARSQERYLIHEDPYAQHTASDEIDLVGHPQLNAAPRPQEPTPNQDPYIPAFAPHEIIDTWHARRAAWSTSGYGDPHATVVTYLVPDRVHVHPEPTDQMYGPFRYYVGERIGLQDAETLRTTMQAALGGRHRAVKELQGPDVSAAALQPAHAESVRDFTEEPQAFQAFGPRSNAPEAQQGSAHAAESGDPEAATVTTIRLADLAQAYKATGAATPESEAERTLTMPVAAPTYPHAHVVQEPLEPIAWPGFNAPTTGAPSASYEGGSPDTVETLRQPVFVDMGSAETTQTPVAEGDPDSTTTQEINRKDYDFTSPPDPYGAPTLETLPVNEDDFSPAATVSSLAERRRHRRERAPRRRQLLLGAAAVLAAIGIGTAVNSSGDGSPERIPRANAQPETTVAETPPPLKAEPTKPGKKDLIATPDKTDAAHVPAWPLPAASAPVKPSAKPTAEKPTESPKPDRTPRPTETAPTPEPTTPAPTETSPAPTETAPTPTPTPTETEPTPEPTETTTEPTDPNEPVALMGYRAEIDSSASQAKQERRFGKLRALGQRAISFFTA